MKKEIISILMILAFGAYSDDLTTKSGKTYTNYKVSEVMSGGVQIMHDDGINVISFSDLPDDLQEKYKPKKKKIETSTDSRTAKNQQIAEKGAEIMKTMEKVTLRAMPSRGYSWELKQDSMLREKKRELMLTFMQEMSENTRDFDRYRKKLNDSLAVAFCNNTMIAYKTNKTLDCILPMTLSVDTYKNTNDVYLQLGGGDECLLVDLNTGDYVKFVEGLIMAFDWSDSCRKDNVSSMSKAIPNMPDSISLVFWHEGGEKGKSSILMTLRGHSAQSKLAKTEAVFLTDIGYNTLYYHLSDFTKKLIKRMEAQQKTDAME